MTRNSKQSELLRRRLLEQRRQLLTREYGELEALRVDGAAAPDSVLDQVDTSSLEIQNELDGALLHIRSEAIRQIDEALARLGRGPFGVCTSCGHVISAARLRALPFAERCLTCATRDEADVLPPGLGSSLDKAPRAER